MMIRLLFALSLGFAGLIHATRLAHAQTAPHCAERLQVIEILDHRYGETRRSIGIAANNTLMEVFANTATGTWTIAVTMPDGVTCLMASGRDYAPVTEVLTDRGDPA